MPEQQLFNALQEESSPQQSPAILSGHIACSLGLPDLHQQANHTSAASTGDDDARHTTSAATIAIAIHHSLPAQPGAAEQRAAPRHVCCPAHPLLPCAPVPAPVYQATLSRLSATKPCH